MFTTIIHALLGAFGIVKRTKKFTTEHNEEFKRSLESCAVICTGAVNAGFVQGGIQGAENSFWQHTFLYIGKTAGEMMRSLYPDIFKKKGPAQLHEIIEAEKEGIVISTLDKYVNPDQQMVAYSRPVSNLEMIKILKQAYSDVGKPYDFLEFIGDAFPDLPIPNPADLNCCASEVTKCWLPVEKIVRDGVDPRRATPAQVNDCLERNMKWSQTRYNW